MSTLKRKKGVVELCMGETTVKAQDKKITQDDFALTVKFWLNSKETLEVVRNVGIGCDLIEGQLLSIFKLK